MHCRIELQINDQFHVNKRTAANLRFLWWWSCLMSRCTYNDHQALVAGAMCVLWKFSSDWRMDTYQALFNDELRLDHFLEKHCFNTPHWSFVLFHIWLFCYVSPRAMTLFQTEWWQAGRLKEPRGCCPTRVKSQQVEIYYLSTAGELQCLSNTGQRTFHFKMNIPCSARITAFSGNWPEPYLPKVELKNVYHALI